MSALTFSLTPKEMIQLAVEHWRLTTALKDTASAPARHGLRKIGEILKAHEIEVRSLDGLPYDQGMSARVLDRVPGDGGSAVVAETVSPLVLCKGQVLQAAEIVVAGA